MTGFDTFVMVDWSGGNQGPVKPRADAIWACVATRDGVGAPVYLRHRQMAEAWLADLLDDACTTGRRVLVGFDFPFGYPSGFGAALTGTTDPFALWHWFADRIEDAPTANNRFDVAGAINLTQGGRGPFWGNGLKRDVPGLPRTKAGYVNPFADRRVAEHRAPGAFTLWQMAGVGSVGGQAMMGLPVLARLRARFAPHVAVWPFEALDRPVAFVEIWPSLTVGPAPEGWIKDAWQVHSVAAMMAQMPGADLAAVLDVPPTPEGWIFGIGHEERLRDAAA